MKSIPFIQRLLLISCVLTLASCSDSDKQNTSQKEPTVDTVIKDIAPGPAAIPKVIDSFQVGNEVFVRSLAIDANSNSLWVGTSTGVLEIDLKTSQLVNTFTRADGLANEYVFAIYVDSLGYKWFGTNAGGASRYKDGKWDVYFPMHGLAD